MCTVYNDFMLTCSKPKRQSNHSPYATKFWCQNWINLYVSLIVCPFCFAPHTAIVHSHCMTNNFDGSFFTFVWNHIRVPFSIDRRSQIVSQICGVCPIGPAHSHVMPNFWAQPGWLTGGTPKSGDAGDPTTVLHRKLYKLYNNTPSNRTKPHTHTQTSWQLASGSSFLGWHKRCKHHLLRSNILNQVEKSLEYQNHVVFKSCSGRRGFTGQVTCQAQAQLRCVNPTWHTG